MASQAPAGLAIDPAVCKLFQPELSALILRVGAVENDYKKREVELKRAQDELAERQKAFNDEMIEERRKLQEAKSSHEQSLREATAKHEQALKAAADKHNKKTLLERESLKKEALQLQEAQRLGSEIVNKQEPVSVEVGGEKFRTELRTLAMCQGSVFPKLVEVLHEREDPRSKRDPSIFIDRDGTHFRFILNYLRQGKEVMKWSAMRNPDRCTLDEILDEARYYKISGLECLITLKKISLSRPFTFNDLAAREYFKKVGTTYESTGSHALEGCNFTGIKFTKVNFCTPITFKNCVMNNATFIECHFNSLINFSNVDLYGVKFERCEGVNNFEGFRFENTQQSDITLHNF